MAEITIYIFYLFAPAAYAGAVFFIVLMVLGILATAILDMVKSGAKNG